MEQERERQPEFEVRQLDAYLREPATDQVLHPPTVAPHVLPFDQRSPEDFERMCVVIAEQVEGLRDARLYGVPGQKQHGLDLVGLNAAGEAVVYQARRWLVFSAGDLRRAVQDYATGRRPFHAKRFVLCVSSSARRTEILEELHRLRASHDFEIDIYDQERLSEMLKQRGDLVRRLFGVEWERVFCLGEPIVAPARSPADLLADAILRGPLEALGSTNSAAEAQEIEDSNPSKAAELYNTVAEALEKSSFASFAATFRQRQAEASIRAGQLDVATQLFVEAGWREVQDGPGLRATETTRSLRELARRSEAATAAGLMADVFSAAERWYQDPYLDLKHVALKIGELVYANAPGCPQAALWLAESAIVSEQYDVVQRSSDVFEALAAAQQRKTESDETAVRLQICIADVTGEWGSLVERALRGRLGPRQATLLHARRGRYLAWRGEPEAADKSYRLAIGQACQANLNAEAAAALRSIWLIGARYGLPEKDWQGALDLARTVRSFGGDYLQSGYDRRAAGLSELADDRLSSALPDLQAYLRLSVVSGRFAAEIDAHSLFGKLYSQAGEAKLATRHYIRSGDLKAVEQLLAGAPSYLDCTGELIRRAPWERATALAALAAEGDLIPDDQTERLARAALDHTRGERQGLFTPWVWLSAYRLLAALGSRIPGELVDPLLELLQPQVKREPNHYQHNDDQHVQIIAALFLAYPGRRDRIGQHLLTLMAASPELGHQVLRYGWDAIQSGSDTLIAGLHKLGDEGSQAALDTLLHLKQEHPLLVREARRLLEKFLNRPQRAPGSYSVGTDLLRTAAFVLLLPEGDRLHFAEAAVDMAEDTSEMEVNRTDALQAIMIVSRSLADPGRTSLFHRSIGLAVSPAFSEADKHLRASLHPLSAFRFDLAFGSLVPQAVRTAAALAHTTEEYQKVIGPAVALFRTGDDFATNQAAHALAQIPPEELVIDIRVLAGSPNHWVRQLAAVLWTTRPDEAPTLGQALATDPDRAVRRVIAESLGRLKEKRPDLAAELAALLSQDSFASVRQAVR